MHGYSVRFWNIVNWFKPIQIESNQCLSMPNEHHDHVKFSVYSVSTRPGPALLCCSETHFKELSSLTTNFEWREGLNEKRNLCMSFNHRNLQKVTSGCQNLTHYRTWWLPRISNATGVDISLQSLARLLATLDEDTNICGNLFVQMFSHTSRRNLHWACDCFELRMFN